MRLHSYTCNTHQVRGPVAAVRPGGEASQACSVGRLETALLLRVSSGGSGADYLPGWRLKPSAVSVQEAVRR